MKKHHVKIAKLPYLPALLRCWIKRALTSSYVMNAQYPGWVTAKRFQFCKRCDQGWNSLEKTSNSNIDIWLLHVRSIVDLRAMASKQDDIGCSAWSVWRNSFHVTIVLRQKVNMNIASITGAENHSILFYLHCVIFK